MLARLGEIARERGLERVEIPFVAGPRNRPAELFLESTGMAPAGFLSAEAAAAVRYRVELRPVAPPAREQSRERKRAVPDYVKFATALRTPEAVLRQHSRGLGKTRTGAGGRAAHRPGAAALPALGGRAQRLRRGAS